MKKSFIILYSVFFGIFAVCANEINLVNADWYQSQDYNLKNPPLKTSAWLPIKLKRTFPLLQGKSWAPLMEYRTAGSRFSAIGWSTFVHSSGLLNFKALKLSELNSENSRRFFLFYDEEKTNVDGDLYFISELSGKHALPERYKTDAYLFLFQTGKNNLIEVFINGKSVGKNIREIIFKGSLFKAHENRLVIKTSAYKNDNFGLMYSAVYPVFEQVFSDPFQFLRDIQFPPNKKTILPLLLKNLPESRWLLPTQSLGEQGLKPYAQTPAFFKRNYQCKTADSAKNVSWFASKNIRRIWVNNQELDLTNYFIKDGVFKQGDNEVVIYTNSQDNGLKNDLIFSAYRTRWLKTEIYCENDNMRIKGELFDDAAKVYIGTKYVGVIHRNNGFEGLGAGVLKKGKNTIYLQFMQTTGNDLMVEKLRIVNAQKKERNHIIWEKNGQPYVDYLSFTGQPYEGTALWNQHSKTHEYTGRFFVAEDSLKSQSLFLNFNPNGTYSDYQWAEKMIGLPSFIKINGKNIPCTKTTNLTKFLVQGWNTIQLFSGEKKAVPVPSIAFSAKKSSDVQPLFFDVSVSRLGKPFLNLWLNSNNPNKGFEEKHFFIGQKIQFNFKILTKKDAEFEIRMNESEIFKKTIQCKAYKVSTLSFRILLDQKSKVGIKDYQFQLFQNDKRIKKELIRVKISEYPKKINNFFTKKQFITRLVITPDFPQKFLQSAFYLQREKAEWLQENIFSQTDKGLNFGPLTVAPSANKMVNWNSILPNGMPFLQKFHAVFKTYITILTKGYPCFYRLDLGNRELSPTPGTLVNYLIWLKNKQKIKINWHLQSLEDYKQLYIVEKQDLWKRFSNQLNQHGEKIIEQIIQEVAPGSVREKITSLEKQ